MRLRGYVGKCIAVITAATLLAGCSSTNQSSEKKGNSEEKETVVTQTAEDKKEQPSSSKDKEEPQFSYWLPMSPDVIAHYVSYNEHPGTKRLERDLGVKVDYTSPAVGQEDEQFNLLIANTDKLPDLIKYDFATKYKGGVEAAIEDGILIDATKIIEENAPNFMKYINSNPDLKKDAYSDGGVIVKFGSIIAGEGMRGLPFQGPFLNKTYLDKAGLDIPETISDWEVMLEAFKKMGVKYPFTFACNNQFSKTSLFDCFASAYGVAAGPNFFQVDGNVKFSPLEPGYKQWVELFAKWYKNGWLDPDFLSKIFNKTIKPDFQSGLVGATVGHMSIMSSAGAMSEKMNIDPPVEGVPAPYPVLNKGDKIHFRSEIAGLNNQGVYITTHAKDPVTIVKWMDYFYSDEGIIATSWGTNGDPDYEDTYYVDDKGQKQRVGAIFDNDPDIGCKYYLNRFTTIWDWDFQHRIYHNEPIKQVAWDVWGKADNTYSMPATMTLTLDENKVYSQIMADVETYVTEMTARYILGIEPLSSYDSFIKTINNMNIKEAIKIQQDALERYNNR